ncbi:MAG: response regulator [Elusimicrobia bacterium]|nr:response regulator [Elusimicrobiota bacterium]
MPDAKKKIVVVEDDPLIRVLYEAILASQYELEQTYDGDSGFAAIQRVLPALAIIDISIPKMHGFELCQKLRADGIFTDVKILFVSAKSYKADIKTAKEIGADDYIVKPFEPEDLRSKVRELVGV